MQDLSLLQDEYPELTQRRIGIARWLIDTNPDRHELTQAIARHIAWAEGSTADHYANEVAKLRAEIARLRAQLEQHKCL